MKVGTLDVIPGWIQPIAHLFVRSKLPFIAIPEGVRTWETFPQKLDYYPEDSLKRMSALRPGLNEVVDELHNKK